MSENVVREKSNAFALRIVRLYKYLCEEKSEYILSKQILLAGTYVGAHIKEAGHAESKPVFIKEMAIALRKASETEYWLQLLFQAEYLDEKSYKSVAADCLELIKLLTSIVKTSKTNTEEL